MRNYIALLVLICGIGISGPVLADGGLYAGIGFGSSSVDIESGILNDGSNISGESKDDTDTSFSFFIGYEVNDKIAIEGGYIDFDEYDVTGTSDGTGFFWWAGPVEIQWEGDAIFLDVIGKHAINDRFDLFGKVGIYDADIDVDLTDSWGIISDSDSNTGLLFGVGLSYSFNEKVSARADLTRFNDVGDDDTVGIEEDIDIIGLNLIFSFN